MSWSKVKQRKGFVFIAGALLCLAFTFPLAAQTDPRLGDLNRDGTLTTLDYSWLLNHINYTNGIRPVGTTGLLTNSLLPFADVTGDGVLDANDLHTLVDGILGKPFAPLPRPVAFFPTHESFTDQIDSIAVRFNQSLLAASLTSSNLILRYSGSNAVLEADNAASSDDTYITFGTLQYYGTSNAIVRIFGTNLPPGAYRATIRPPITNATANASMNRPYSWEFKTLGDLDTDGDGIPDRIEKFLTGYNTNNPISFADGIRDGDRDYDNDDLSNSNEVFRATSITNGDTDGDGWADGVEVADTSAITPLGKDPRNPLSHPDWSIVAAPSVDVLRPGTDEAPSLGNSLIVARPLIEILRPGQDEALSAANIGIVIAKPPIEILRPDVDETQGLAVGSILARPPVEVRLPSTNELSATGTIVAVPPIHVTNGPPTTFSP